jgi:hypothetical protein
MVDFYTVLEVSRDASPEEIKRSYHRLALRYHPDKAGPEGAAKFKEINTAYEVLSDPQKKSIYDAYGEAGLDAMDNPVAGGAMAALGPTVSILTALLLLILAVAMTLIFLAFLVSYVDGHLHSWNYVKVFSPLFVIDVVLGVPSILLFFMFLITMPKHIPVHCVFLAIFCAIILTIVVPIAKDRNEARASEGRTDFLKWRVWLIPGYLFSVFTFIASFFFALPTQQRILKLKSMGLVYLANYLPIGFIFTMLQAACIVIFFALVACRADEAITTNYFVIIGVPIFVGLTFFLINRFAFSILKLYVGEVPPEAQAAAQAAEEAANGEEPSPNAAPQPEGNDNSNGGAPNPMRGPAGEKHDAPCAEEQHYSTESPHHSNSEGVNNVGREGNNHNGADQQEHSAPGGRNPYAGQQGSCGDIALYLVLCCLIVGLLMASTAMIAVRLNHYYNYRTYANVLTLAKACIPLFFIIGGALLSLMVGCILVCCGVASIVVVGDEAMPHDPENGEGGNQKEAEAEEMHGDSHANDNGAGSAAANNSSNKKNNAAVPAAQSTDTAPSVPHQDADTTGRPMDAGRAAQEFGTTPPERQPDNEHLSDID